jgi:DNA mismatch repair protein MLH1
MLDEYFSLSLTSEGHLESLPLLLKGYTPELDNLPHFLLCLGTRVDWSVEKTCFEGFMKELAYFYAPRTRSDSEHQDKLGEPGRERTEGEDEHEEEGEDRDEDVESEDKHKRWQLEHILWPSMRRYTSWTRDSLTNGDLKQVANLPDLFRIFERC